MAKVDPNDLVDADDVARMIGLRNANGVSVYRSRHADFPVPVVNRGKCVLWQRQQVERWAAKWLARSGEGTRRSTPESRRDRYRTEGRPLSDWEALREAWERSEELRRACRGSFSNLEHHAYAEDSYVRKDGGHLRALAHQVLVELGFVVTTDPIHFVRGARRPRRRATD